MRQIPFVGLAPLASLYDVFLIDQFGVLRDDVGAYEGAAEALAFLKGEGRTVVILSNSGRSGQYNADRFQKLGFDRACFDHFVTSGDAAFTQLSGSNSKLSPGQRCFTISSGSDHDLADRLELVSVDNANKADLIVISGSEAERIPLEVYETMLRGAVERNLPCYCTNPDIHKLANGSLAPGAGSIAKLYEQMGGTVIWFGKPHPEIYAYAISLLGDVHPSRVVCIGDSVGHDILGATLAGCDSVLVDTGILQSNTEQERLALMDEIGAWAKFRMQRFHQ
jgi:HAD superfamily hydrolase (TIGR01459 family)